ncbi:MAG: hypothetical protein KIS96_01290 [Bauldia sp.]|nr:hypothetical protein [Bauldia sp.]
MKLALTAIAFGLGLGATGAAAQEIVRFGPFYFEDQPWNRTLHLDGPIEEDAASDFLEAKREMIIIDTLVIDSPGGDLDEARVIADLVFGNAISTRIPEGASCFDACVLVFLAGLDRRAEGDFGVGPALFGTWSDPLAGYERFETRYLAIVDRFQIYDVDLRLVLFAFNPPAVEGEADIYILRAIELWDLNIERSERDYTSEAWTFSLRSPPDLEALLRVQQELDVWCNAGSAVPLAPPACLASSLYARLLHEQGWCYGRRGQSTSQSLWHVCGPDSRR